MDRRSAVGPHRVPWLFTAPAVLLYGALLLGPSLVGAAYAFTDWDGLTSPHWVGVANFREFLGEPEGTGVLVRTIVLALLYVVGVNAAGLGLALALERTLRTRNLLRALFFVPAVVSPLVVAYIWKFVLDADGPLNAGLEAAGLGALAQPWLGDPATALGGIVVVMVWQFSGYHMLIYLAGLQGVQPELREAAAVDGAGPWRCFRDITLPLLRPALTVAALINVMNVFNNFPIIWVMTHGQPGYSTATSTIFMFILKGSDIGESAAMSVVNFGMVIVLVAIFLKVTNWKTEVPR